MSYVTGPINLQGNLNPPGAFVPAGSNTMPAYQPLPGRSDIGPTAAITKHVGNQQNWWIVHHFVNRFWTNGFHETIREGQLIFIARSMRSEDDMQTMINLYQLNHILFEGYSKAMNIIRTGQIPDGVTYSIAEIRDCVGYNPENRNVQGRFNGISEKEIDEYLGRPQAFEDEIPDGIRKNKLRIALDLAYSKHFRYLWAPAILLRWNFWGVVNNISKGTSPEGKQTASGSHRASVNTTTVNCVIAKKAHTSNVFGNGKTDIAEGSKVYLVLRRRNDGNGNYGSFEMVPTSSMLNNGVSDSVTAYEDISGKFCHGPVITVGTITEITARPPAPNKIRQAVGNGKEVSLTQAHQATGGLPKIVIQLRV